MYFDCFSADSPTEAARYCGTEQAGGAYIRPIVLFQAQPKVNEDSETFDKIKAMLVDMGIPKEQIAVKTSKVDELGKTDLMSRD